MELMFVGQSVPSNPVNINPGMSSRSATVNPSSELEYIVYPPTVVPSTSGAMYRSMSLVTASGTPDVLVNSEPAGIMSSSPVPPASLVKASRLEFM